MIFTKDNKKLVSSFLDQHFYKFGFIYRFGICAAKSTFVIVFEIHKMASNLNRTLFLFFALFIFLMVSCNQDITRDISDAVSKIKSDHISDARLVYWNVVFEKNVEGSSIEGATTSEPAFSELQNLANKNKVEFNVEHLPNAEFQNNPWGIVTLSVCNIRSKASHSAELLTQALLGTPVKIFKKQQGWFLIQTPDRYFGWVDAAGITPKNKNELAEWKNLEKVIFNQQFGFVYSEANTKSEVCSDLVLADLLSVTESEKGFYEIFLPDGRTGFVKTEECTSLDLWNKKEVAVNRILSAANQFLGTPYLWGGTSAKMVDCSGFTKTVYYLNGIILQRDASQQTLYGDLVDTQKNYENLQTGDLVFFGRSATETKSEKVTHVGLYIGNSEFIHASGKVRINSLDNQKENYTEYYETAFVRARRIVNNVDGTGIEWVTENEFYKEILPE